MEDDAGEIHHITFHNVYYFPRSPNLLITPQTWYWDRGEDEIRHERTYLKVMGKRPVLVWENGKYQRTTLHSPGCARPETNINQCQDGLTKFHSMFAEIFKDPDMIHACGAVATPQQSEIWTHQTHITVVTAQNTVTMTMKIVSCTP